MFNIKSSKLVAQEAHQAIGKKVKKSIDYLVRECISKLQLSRENILLTSNKLFLLSYISPEIHFYHHMLQDAMRSQDTANAIIFLDKLLDSINRDIRPPLRIKISTIENSEWENFIVAEAMKLTKADCGHTARVLPISASILSVSKYHLTLALNTIAQYDPNTFEEIQTHVQQIKLFKGKITMGFTDVRILGAMLIRVPRKNVNPVTYFIEHIVHEASHIHLNSLMAIDPLIFNSPQERFVSPLRPDLRPMFGVFHATYVSAKISQTFMKLFQAVNNKEFLFSLAETLDETIRGINEIEKNAKLTAAGKELVESIKELVNEAKLLPLWKQYNFKTVRTHRFGVGISKLTYLEHAVI